ncbi:Serine/threonine-protein kinase ATM [Trichinella pseudospiralis]
MVEKLESENLPCSKSRHVENDSECAAFLTYWKLVIWRTFTCGEQENASEEEASEKSGDETTKDQNDK